MLRDVLPRPPAAGLLALPSAADIQRRDGHRNVCLDPPWPDMLVHDEIVYAEVLDRPPLD